MVDNMVKIKPHESLYSCFTPSGSGYIVHAYLCTNFCVISRINFLCGVIVFM